MREHVVEHLAEPDAVLVIDETGFLKRGRASCGVGRRYTGSAGKIANCQIGVSASYVSTKGHAFIDRALYLPKTWTSDPARLAAAHVPQERQFAIRPRLAVGRVERAVAAGVPFAWVAADSVYGVSELEMALRRAGRGYVLGVKGNHWFGSWDPDRQIAGEAQDIAQALWAKAWQGLSAGRGTKGERLYDWAYCPPADLDAAEYDAPATGIWTRGRLIRRSLADGEHAYFATWCPAPTPIETLVRVEGTRWRVEEGFEITKTELGLDHNESRSWHGWHRDVSLVMLAGHAGLCRDDHRPIPGKRHRAENNKAGITTKLIHWSIQEIRRLAVKPMQRRIPVPHILVWSTVRRTHQATAHQALPNARMQLSCWHLCAVRFYCEGR